MQVTGQLCMGEDLKVVFRQHSTGVDMAKQTKTGWLNLVAQLMQPVWGYGGPEHAEQPRHLLGAGGNVPEGVRRHLEGAAVAIWTTTGWTIPANQAVAVNERLQYAVVEAQACPLLTLQ